jgi:hypothetical protein
MRKNITSALLAIMLVSGCTVIGVKPVDKSQNLMHVCISENPKVIIEGFTLLLQASFERHLITSEIFLGALPKGCDFRLEYTALRSWDLATYMSYAELELYKGKTLAGYAEYRLRGGIGGRGGLNLTKYDSTESKLSRMVDELLEQYN